MSTSSALFLYESLNELSSMGGLNRELPACLAPNLNPVFAPRPYQAEAFARFIHCYQHDFPGKSRPLHLMFNMATGSGKTLIMAGLMLYLYEQGYRNFLFFVNSTNIIEKTKDNFLNSASSKYLFARSVTLLNRRVTIQAVENFEAASPVDINVCFTTIQKLHSDLNAEKENALTFEDFRKHRIVLIADEAHHINVQTLAQETLLESWENSVERIFRQNEANLLLEFTATHDYENAAMVDKYRRKVLIRYDLKQFRDDRYSKDIVIVQSDFGLDERILQALILSQYKQDVAALQRIDLKPIILFKAQKTIDQSIKNKANFHRLIENLSPAQVASIRASQVAVIQAAFHFYDQHRVTNAQLTERLKQSFAPQFCLSANDNEIEKAQLLLNSLEGKNNHIRVIFAVQKLSEGWDVLNLFDIVRCYETRDTGHGRLGRTTISEAQLIGRGARYFPFTMPEQPDRYRRKFDSDMSQALRVLEELHYHSINDSRYIAEIRTALVAQGAIDEQSVEKSLELKDSFKRSQFYKHGVIFTNKRKIKDYRHITSFSSLGAAQIDYTHIIASGRGSSNKPLDDGTHNVFLADEGSRTLRVSEIDRNIVEAAIARCPFFTFEKLHPIFPNITSINDLITSEDYLGGLQITFRGDIYDVEHNRVEQLKAVVGLLNQVEAQSRACIVEYQGSKEFNKAWVREVFKDKKLKFDANNPHAADDPQFKYFVNEKYWFAFNTLYGTSEEKAFVRMLSRQMEKLEARYKSVYLLRNKNHFALYDFMQGRQFQPDFVLFLKQKNGSALAYQLFIEPKGRFLQTYDQWKAEFLKQISMEFKQKTLKFENENYRLIGVPFYNNEEENAFIDDFREALSF